MNLILLFNPSAALFHKCVWNSDNHSIVGWWLSVCLRIFLIELETRPSTHTQLTGEGALCSGHVMDAHSGAARNLEKQLLMANDAQIDREN